ncbi:MAG TPA: PAS domain S-box protein [Gallionella sp.]|nr:PAS domain S-box protein [Gallionella sp.]
MTREEPQMTPNPLEAEIEELRVRLAEAQDMLRAIRSGEVDALVVQGPQGEQIYTLKSAEEPYRVMVEAMTEGAVTYSVDGTILYCNARFAAMMKTPLEQIIGTPLHRFVPPHERHRFAEIVAQSRDQCVHREICLQAQDGARVPVLMSACGLRNGRLEAIAATITDLTEVSAAAEARARLALIVESTDDAIVSMTPEGVIETWNAGGERIFGYTAAEVIGRPYQQFARTQEQIDWVEQRLVAIRRGERVEHGEMVWPRKDGTLVDISMSLSPVMDVTGTLAGVSTILRDITQRKRAEEQLRQSHERLKLITETIQDVFWISTPGVTEMLYISPAYERLWEHSCESLYDNPQSLLEAVHPDDRPGLLGIVNGAHAKGEAYETVYRMVRRNGEVRWMRERGFPVRDADGRVTAMTGVVTDVTDQKRAEDELRASAERFRSIFEYSPIGNSLTSLTGEMQPNKAFCDMLGYSREEFAARRWQAVSHPDDIESSQREMDRVLSGEQTVARFTKRYLHKNGNEVWGEVTTSLHRDAAGKPLYFITQVMDVTERKRTEAELRKYQEHLQEMVAERTAQLEAVNKELESFSYSVSHDLRAPLRAADGFARMTLARYGDKLDAEGRRLLTVIRDNTEKMGRLIDDLLAFSRIGRTPLTLSEVDMEGMVSAVLEELRPATGDRQLTIEVGKLPPARGELALLRQVWINLLSNAIKFTRSKSMAHIEVGGRTEGREQIYYVRDNGSGFDMRYIDKIFEVFQRLHGAEEFEGTGVGLAIVKRIVTRHGGRVWAEGKLDEGATFYFALPV